MKTVYILGAGFSVEAGAPTQAKILSKAFELHNNNHSIFDERKFSTFKRFLKNQLNIKENDLDQVEIEDIFTPLDRCMTDSIQFRGVTLNNIMNVRESVFYVIGKTLNELLKDDLDKGYIDTFAQHITEISSSRVNNYKSCDPISVLSTNWDILLDNSIHNHIKNNNLNAVVDYCCYISSQDEHDNSIMPGLEKIGSGGFNVKLLKLHGSLNWLQCQRCSRLYVKFDEKIGATNLDNQKSCRHCDRNFKEEKGKHLLISNLIMPTYIKDLSNPQYKIIWQNAGIEISEASKIVFIGYSLPTADFEMRQLLARMTRKNATIEVVDYCLDDEIESKKQHWSNFFGKRKITFYSKGARNYILNQLCRR